MLSAVDLRDFLKDQGEDASLVHAQSLILTYELNEWGTVLVTINYKIGELKYFRNSKAYLTNIQLC